MSKQKPILLDVYINKTHSEINERAINTLKPIYKDSDLIVIEDSIVPVLLVLSSDILNGNHELAVNQAATLKVSGLALKSIQAGESPNPGIPDINNLMPIVQNIFGSIPMITGCLGSLVECIGNNINAQNKDLVFQFGLAMHMGASSNPLKSATMREIGITIGNLYEGTDKEHNWNKFNTLVKTLPRNKYQKRLKELAERYYKEANTEGESSLKAGIEINTKKETKEINKIPFHINKANNDTENNTLRVDTLKTASEETVTFIADSDEFISEKVKKQKEQAEKMKKD